LYLIFGELQVACKPYTHCLVCWWNEDCYKLCKNL